jgi:hypothetical protein
MHPGQLFFNQPGIVPVGHHKNVFPWTNIPVPLCGLLYHGFAGPQYIVKLFWESGSAKWPEPAADSTCHDDDILV